MAPIITLTTDFGLADGYVAAMKGVILSINPDAALVDVTHQVPPQDIFHGAYVLSAVYRYFPQGSVHVAVVDPGVGSQRRALAVWDGRRCLVGPDNGVLSLALEWGSQAPPPGATLLEAAESPLPPGCVAVELTEQRFHLPQVSATFHGRDVFAPVAAHLSKGLPIEALGPRVSGMRRFFIPPPALTEGAVQGLVVHIDTFGNAVTNIRRERLPGGRIKIEAGSAIIRGVSPAYAAVEGPVAVWGSNGYLEIAVKNGSAAAALGLRRGDRVRVQPMG